MKSYQCVVSPPRRQTKSNQAAPTRDFGEPAASAPAELGGEIHNVSRYPARTQVPLQARKLHVYGSGTFGAFWNKLCCDNSLDVHHSTSRRSKEYQCQ